jgi:hypothetical protein
MIERWLREHLERCGLWNADRVSRRASSATCRQCHRVMLVGLDADRCALVATVDPAALSAQGEMLAHLLGLRTYSLRWLIDTLEINRRDQWSIKYSPARHCDAPDCPGSRLTYDIVAEHRCSVQQLPGVRSVHAGPRLSLGDEPPF